MIQTLGLIVGAIIELYHGYSMSTYLWMAGISVAVIVACILSIFAGIAKWGEDGGLIGFLITIVGGVVFGTVLLIAIGGAITQVLMGLI